MKDKAKIAVSACLLGQRVRYDGKEKKHKLIVEVFLNQLSDKVEFIPFCPEVAIGLGIPRPKIQVVKSDTKKNNKEQIRVLGVENHRLDVTEPLISYAETFLQQHPDIKAFIVKSKSPSCGFLSTPLFEASLEGSYKQIDFTSGMFVQSLLKLKPELQIIEESQLTSEYACLSFLKSI
ncbi:MAG: DUF523 domain-containing protein [Gammaproteobacteria bacterium]|nr:DUF523 domain-containing protein [Gammaproteobacteria bacterium]